ncbi:hypothetical protein CR513_49282, partial [Mucuna pruriens]
RSNLLGFKIFPYWLEFSLTTDGTYCLPCYLFSKKPSDNTCLPHNNTMKAFYVWLSHSNHTRNIINVQSSSKFARIVYVSRSLLIQFLG